LSLLLLQLEGRPVWGVSNLPQSAAKTQVTSLILDRIQQEVDVESVSDRSYEDLAKILEKEPTNPRAHLLLANSYDLLGMPEEAYANYRLALKYGPDDPKAIVGMIKSETKAGRTMIASALVTDALKRFPDNPEIKFWAANFLYSSNKIKEAEAFYKEALESKNEIVGLPSALAVIRFRQRRYVEAVALARRDLRKNPNLMLANEVAGLALMKLERYGQAVEPLHIAFIATPLKDLVSQEYAQALYWKGDYVEALRPALVNLAVTGDLYGNNVFSKNVLGRILRHVQKRDLAKMIQEVSGRLGIDNSAAFHFSLGDDLDRYGFRDLAMQQYRRGLQIEPAFGRGWYRLGLDLETYAHDYPEALNCLQKAKALLPEDEAVAKHLLRLEDRWATYRADWAWQFKDWLKNIGLLK
jgi:tetratricopeptide (TPR) repeat protein